MILYVITSIMLSAYSDSVYALTPLDQEHVRTSVGVIFHPTHRSLTAVADSHQLTFTVQTPIHKIIGPLQTPRNFCSKNYHRSGCREIFLNTNKIFRNNIKLREKIETVYQDLSKVMQTFVLRNPTKFKRSFIPFAGSVLNNLFGVATESQLQKVVDKVQLTMKNSEVAAKERTELMKDIAQLSETVNTRVDGIWHFINDSTETLVHTVQSLRKYERFFYTRLNQSREQILEIQEIVKGIATQTSLLQLQSLQVQLLNYYEMWLTSLVTLMKGRLPEGLIRFTSLSEALNKLKSWCASESTMLTPLSDPLFLPMYYEITSVRSFIQNDVLFITFMVPLVHQRDVYHVFRVETFPTPIHSHDEKSQDGYVQLSIKQQYFAIRTDSQRYTMLSDSDYTVCVESQFGLCPVLSVATSIQTPHCIAAIWHNLPEMIDKTCEFRIHTKPMETNVMYLSKGKYLLSNIPSPVRIVCPENVKFVDVSYFTVISVPCKCFLQTQSFTTDPNLSHCINDFDAITVEHPINYILLSSFNYTNYIDGPFTSFSSNETPRVPFPKIDNFLTKQQLAFAADHKLGTKMSDLSNLKDQKASYQKDDIPSPKFTSQATWSWRSVTTNTVLSIMELLNWIFTIYLFISFRPALSSITLARATNAFIITTTQRSTTVEADEIQFPEMTYIFWIFVIISVSVTFQILLKLVKVSKYRFPLFTFCQCFWQPPKTSESLLLFLKHSSVHHDEMIFLTSIPFEQGIHKFTEIPTVAETALAHSCLFWKISINYTGNVKISDACNTRLVKLPVSVCISHKAARKIGKNLQSDSLSACLLFSFKNQKGYAPLCYINKKTLTSET